MQDVAFLECDVCCIHRFFRSVYLSIRALCVRVRGSDLGSSLHSRCNGKVARSSGRLDVGLDEKACRLVLGSSSLHVCQVDR